MHQMQAEEEGKAKSHQEPDDQESYTPGGAISLFHGWMRDAGCVNKYQRQAA